MKNHDPHRGNSVSVGKFVIHAGGTMYFRAGDLEAYDLIIPLTEDFHLVRGNIQPYPMKDFGGVPEDWPKFLEGVIEELEQRKKILAFCAGSHGRTGCFLASLVAILEPATVDPIEAVRERHCLRAVETKAQAGAIFALRGQLMPDNYSNLR